MQLISQFYRWGNCAKEKLIYLPKVTDLVSSKDGLEPQLFGIHLFQLKNNLIKTIFVLQREKFTPTKAQALLVNVYKNHCKEIKIDWRKPIQWTSNGYIFWYPSNSIPSSLLKY